MNATECPVCEGESEMIRTRVNSDGMYCRRRECKSCGYRWTTAEIPVEALPAINPD